MTRRSHTPPHGEGKGPSKLGVSSLTFGGDVEDTDTDTDTESREGKRVESIVTCRELIESMLCASRSVISSCIVRGVLRMME